MGVPHGYGDRVRLWDATGNGTHGGYSHVEEIQLSRNVIEYWTSFANEGYVPHGVFNSRAIS